METEGMEVLVAQEGVEEDIQQVVGLILVVLVLRVLMVGQVYLVHLTVLVVEEVQVQQEGMVLVLLLEMEETVLQTLFLDQL